MPSSDKRKRTSIVNIRVLPSEKEELKSRAFSANTSVAGYIKHCALDLPPPRKPRSLNIDQQRVAILLLQLGQMRGNFGQIGNNLNQIAKAANQGKYLEGLHAAALADLEAAIVDFTEMRAACMEALGREI